MSTAEESPAQRAARLRRERREAKIKDGGAARLDKITSLSGRTPQPAQDAPSPSPSPSPQPPAFDSPTPAAASQPPPPNTAGQAPPPPAAALQQQQPQPPAQGDLQAQQEFIRSLLRQGAPPSSDHGPAVDEDPMMTLLGSLMKGATTGEQGSGPGSPFPGAGAGAGPGADGPIPGMNPADIAQSLGVPPFLANLLGAATQPQSEEEKRSVWTWKVLHAVFSIVVGVYLLVVLGSSMATYGSRPPPPATARSPFLYFTTGELVLTGARVMMRRGNGNDGLGMYIQLVRDVIRDGSVVIFLLGMGAWWYRGWTAY